MAVAQHLEALENLDLPRYDPGCLNDYGGGNTAWWFDYIHHLLADAHDHYIERARDLAPKAVE